MLLRPLLLLATLAAAAHAEDWPQWRGPRADGRSAETAFPTTWSKTENVVWRTPLPGTGHASPIVYDGKVFTVAASAETQERILLCLDRANGKLLWQQTVLKAPMEPLHRENSHASSTPACDGERVFCTFLDGREVVVAAYDLAGKQLWLKRPGVFSSVHGFSSTPVLYKDKVIVNCDHDGDGYIVALARTDGHELWRIDRPNKTRSYCTPLIREAAGRMQMVLSGSKCIASYDPDTGALLWIVDGPTDQFVASPVFSEKTGFFYITGGFPDHHIMAIRPDGTGNVTSTHVVWHHRTGAGVSYVPSPIIEGGWFLLTDDRGFAHAFDSTTGEIVWNERFARTHASPVSAAGLVWFLDDKGVCRVVKPADKFALIATNDLGEATYASPALSGGQIFLRTDQALYCIGPAKPAGTAGVLKLGTKALNFAWNNTVGPWQRDRDRINAEDTQRRANTIAARKALVAPAVLPQAPEDFFTYDGFRDWWRLPLVFPYEPGWIDTFESAHLQRYRGGDVRNPNKSSEGVQGIRDIADFSFDRRFLIGRQGPNHSEKDRPESWFIFEFATAAVSQFGSEREMLEAAKTRGFTGELSLKPNKQSFDEYFR